MDKKKEKWTNALDDMMSRSSLSKQKKRKIRNILQHCQNIKTGIISFSGDSKTTEYSKTTLDEALSSINDVMADLIIYSFSAKPAYIINDRGKTQLTFLEEPTDSMMTMMKDLGILNN